jgi:N-acetylglucosaminyl-diphospho-decaprenol L-rhamnosyltransferase
MDSDSERAAQALLSVIIVTHNTWQLTRDCLQSVLTDCAQLDGPAEIIVVDNASTDDSATLVRGQFPQVRLIVNESNLGFSRGNNLGLEAAHGRYLLLLNSDTQVQAGALGSLIEFMDTHPEAGACGPMLLNEDGSLQPSGHPLPSFWSVALAMTRAYRLWKADLYIQPGRDYRQVARVGEVSGAAIMVRKEVYQQVGGLDENFFAYYEDVDWCKRIGQAGHEICYVPTARVMHRWHGTSREVSEQSHRAGQQSIRYYFAKHHGRAAQLGIQLLLVSKEAFLMMAALCRRDRNSVDFHRDMLRCSLTPGPR